jgi:hypothetical protein
MFWVDDVEFIELRETKNVSLIRSCFGMIQAKERLMIARDDMRSGIAGRYPLYTHKMCAESFVLRYLE